MKTKALRKLIKHLTEEYTGNTAWWDMIKGCELELDEIENRGRAEGQLETDVSLRDGLTNAREALEEIQKYNRIGNDLDAYLYELTEWALGKQEEKPNPKNYGVWE